MSSTPAILALPTELHLLILSYLSVAERQLLRATCHYFFSLIDPLKSNGDFLTIERSVYNLARLYYCQKCSKLSRFDMAYEYETRRSKGTCRICSTVRYFRNVWIIRPPTRFGYRKRREMDEKINALNRLRQDQGLSDRPWARPTHDRDTEIQAMV